jgi:hypothetical protein
MAWEDYFAGPGDYLSNLGAGDSLNSLGSGLGSAGTSLDSAASQAWNAIKPPSTANVDQAVQDARALQQQFVGQMNQQQPTPGLQFYGSAPTAAANPGYPPGYSPPGGGDQTLAYGSPTPVATPVGPAPIPGSGAPTGGAPTPPPGSMSGVSTPVYGTQPSPTPTAGPAPSSSASLGTSPLSAYNRGGFGQSGGGGDLNAMNKALGIGGGNNPFNTQPNFYNEQRALAAAGYWPGATPGAGGAGAGGGAPAAALSAPGMEAATMQAAPEYGGATIDQSQQAQFRQGQLGLAQNIAGVLTGQAPSVAQIQQQQAFGQQQAQQLGMAAAAGRGGNQALAMRNAMYNTGNLGAQQASASALLRAQEQATARAQMGGVLEQGRASDIGLATNQAQLQQQAGLQNQANIQQAGAQNAQMLQQANAANQQSQVATRGQAIQEQAARANQAIQAQQNQVLAATGGFNANMQKQQAYGGLIGSGLGALATLSDRRAKRDVEPLGSPSVQEFLGALKPSEYRYAGRTDRKAGVMAQDVEKSRVGRTMVRDTRVGKVIDIQSATGAMLAALGDLHQRISRVEGARGVRSTEGRPGKKAA